MSTRSTLTDGEADTDEKDRAGADINDLRTSAHGSDRIEAAEVSAFSGPYRLTSIGLLIMVTMVAFEAMAVTTAMPAAARELGGLANYAWAFSGFIVANIVGIVGAGVAGTRRGPKPSLVIGLIAFVAGLLLAGAATTMLQLIAGRVVQGFGAGTLVTAIYVVIGETYPDSVRPRIFALMSGAWVLPGLAGPPLSGLITEHLGWRWVFLALAPIALAASLLMVPRLRSMTSEPRQDEPVSGRPQLVRALVLALSVAVLSQAGQNPAPIWIAPVVIALAAVVWAVPGLLPAGTFRVRRGVPATVALRGLLAGGLFGADAFIPLVMTVQHHWSPATAGLPLAASAVSWSTGSWVQSRRSMAGRHPALVRGGFTFLILGLAGAALASLPGSPGWLMYTAWTFAGMGAGLGISSLSVLMMEQTTDADRARDSAATQLSDGVTTSFTLAVGGVLISAAAHGTLSYTAAFVLQDSAMIVLAVIGFVTAARTRRPAA